MRSGLLFVGGNPRSGTTALNRILNQNPRVFIGRERFLNKLRRGELRPELYEEARFFDLHGDDTHEGVHDQVEGDVAALREKFRAAKIYGDKLPPIFRTFSYLWKRFPDVRVLYIVRNPLSVAESYQRRFENPADTWQRDYRRAILDWNESVTKTLSALKLGRAITVVTYERLFASESSYDALFDALGVERSEEDRKAVSEAVEKYTKLADSKVLRHEEIRHFVALHAAYEPYREIVNSYCILRGNEPNATAPVSAKRRVKQALKSFAKPLFGARRKKLISASAEKGFI